MGIKGEIRRVLWKVGFDLIRFQPTSHYMARRKRFFELYGIDLVLDVGANTGQYAKQLRQAIKYSEKIISFEPLRKEFTGLNAAASKDPKWDARNYALGSSNGFVRMNIAGNSLSSSILEMLPSHSNSAPESKNIGEETVEVRTLDSVFYELSSGKENIYLKIDSQGYEGEILKGAANSLEFIDTLQLEMALTPLYQGETLFSDLHSALTARGYSLVSIEPGFSDVKSARMLQVDGIYHRFR